MCDEVTAIQYPKSSSMHATTEVESVVFNARVDDTRSESNSSVHSGYQAMWVAQLCQGHQVPLF